MSKKATDGLLVTKLSEALGWSRDRVSRMTSPGSNPGIQDVITLCEASGISITYVLTGKREDPVYDGVISEMSKLTQAELKSLQNHLSAAPLVSEPGEEPGNS
ncbi:hypothetical protein [Phaeobacter gallaeciensis]|uniref:hypothetical protein n=1 Tax=Phaeobacter gallaeciensis TaxID=60890 RepID=UPI000BC00DD2|nr:hypothetical protein [Phaeobacter gallaeciensis]ATF18001.1 hypothetical protein PhaeoP129_01364 [Phaeobacter gallaeciensis]ATF22110.1 hypothetical protein PhaeoP128_01364 [Phaeobacter gallaeciensis]